MKNFLKTILVLVTLVICRPLIAQDDLGSKVDPGMDIRNTAVSLVPELDLMNKILFVNVWRSDDQLSRDNGKEFLRVSNIYSQAKLKNGSSGVAFINICIDSELHTWIMSVKKDGIESKFNLENSNEKYNSLVKYFDGKTGNIVIGNDGTTLAKDLKQEDCFPLFRSYITR